EQPEQRCTVFAAPRTARGELLVIRVFRDDHAAKIELRSAGDDERCARGNARMPVGDRLHIVRCPEDIVVVSKVLDRRSRLKPKDAEAKPAGLQLMANLLLDRKDSLMRDAVAGELRRGVRRDQQSRGTGSDFHSSAPSVYTD